MIRRRCMSPRSRQIPISSSVRPQPMQRPFSARQILIQGVSMVMISKDGYVRLQTTVPPVGFPGCPRMEVIQWARISRSGACPGLLSRCRRPQIDSGK